MNRISAHKPPKGLGFWTELNLFFRNTTPACHLQRLVNFILLFGTQLDYFVLPESCYLWSVFGKEAQNVSYREEATKCLWERKKQNCCLFPVTISFLPTKPVRKLNSCMLKAPYYSTLASQYLSQKFSSNGFQFSPKSQTLAPLEETSVNYLGSLQAICLKMQWAPAP